LAVIHLVSHTHWDREWYLTFQQFRLKLVHLIDELLFILKTDPDYGYFMLDGQAILLEDYLEIRPERAPELRRHIQKGRILAGPWYCLPDEFLVSPESLIRNLAMGMADSRKFGACMEVGYIPDSFGHIGQMPQILAGFGLGSAVAWRGIGDQLCELWWESPNGARILLAYLRESYSNAVKIPGLNDEATVSEAAQQLGKLLPFSQTGHLLLMQGTDHIEPRAETTAALTRLNSALPEHRFLHSNLSSYINAVLEAVSNTTVELPLVRGELRCSKRQPLLTGTLALHNWVKRRNHDCEMLLEQWTEPLSAYAELISGVPENQEAYPANITNLQPLVHHAWRMLMKCHPHDSICASSIDQVVEELRPRFDQVEQLGEAVRLQALDIVMPQIDTLCPCKDSQPDFSVTVFNPVAGPRSDAVQIEVILDDDNTWIEIVDSAGTIIPCQLKERGPQHQLLNTIVGWDGLVALSGAALEGSTHGIMVHNLVIKRSSDELGLDFIMDDTGSPMLKNWEEEITHHLADTSIKTFNVNASAVKPSLIEFVAENVPGHGYATYWIRKIHTVPHSAVSGSTHIENAYFRLESQPATGLLSLLDKRTGSTFNALNRFVDGGDCGDMYNYCPPRDDSLIDSQKDAEVRSVSVIKGITSQSMEIDMVMPVPKTLAATRQSRSLETDPIEILTRATLIDGVERVDISTSIKNTCSDHRLRVHFTVPFNVNKADYDGHFEVVSRPLDLPAHDDSWIEQPAPAHPQRCFIDISDGALGLMVADRGLREAEAIRVGRGTEIALTLLRCVGWLSLDNLPVRKGHAGPPFMATPLAQMQGTYNFDYSIIPHKGTWRDAYRHAYEFNARLRAVIGLPHPGTLPGAGSFLHVEPATFIITAIKVAEDGDGMIVRGYNITPEAVAVRLRTVFPFKSICRTRLDETTRVDIDYSPEGTVRFQAGANEIVTLRFNNVYFSKQGG
jgi:alpha-mannosidase